MGVKKPGKDGVPGLQTEYNGPVRVAVVGRVVVAC
jgi:hypothetical protein